MSTKTCVIMSHTEKSILDILIHVFILSSILSIFFFVVIAPLEKNSLENEVNKNIEDGMKCLMKKLYDANHTATHTQGNTQASLQKLLMPSPTQRGLDSGAANLKKIMEKLKIYYKGENQVNATYNKGLKTSLIIVLLFLLTSIIVVYILYKRSCGKCPKILPLIGENLLLFAIIGIIEYMFFIKIASKYIPIKPSLIVKTVNKTL